MSPYPSFPSLAWCATSSPLLPVTRASLPLTTTHPRLRPLLRLRLRSPARRPRAPRLSHHDPTPDPHGTDPGTPAQRHGLLTDSELETKWKGVPPSDSTSSTRSVVGPSPSADQSPSREEPPLVESVLETKWRNDAARKNTMSTSEDTNSSKLQRPTSSSYRPPPGDITASDPYKAFARFTRLAAPTAALGQNRQTVASPNAYSAGAIAHRLLRYQLSNANLRLFVSLFCGEFDNYVQVAMERAAGMQPGDGGGHEHIHCSIVQVAPTLLFARYYFNGDPARVFRSRLYAVTPSDRCERGIVEMRIFRFYEETLQQLQRANYDVTAIQWQDDDVYDWLRGCEVFWERYDPPEDNSSHLTHDDAAEELGIHPGTRFVGYMEGGGCECYSPEIEGRIRVMDDLLLTENELWVADRGFDDSNNFVYGNRSGIPYKMRRVLPDSELAWTLSANTPPPDGYVP